MAIKNWDDPTLVDGDEISTSEFIDMADTIQTNTTNISDHTSDSTIHFIESSIDHTAISNIGTNSHSDIDAHISDSTIHFTESNNLNAVEDRLCTDPSIADHVVIAEANYDPTGADGDSEYLVLYNPTSSSVDISGWTVQTAGSTWTNIATIPASQSIASNGYYLVGGADVETGYGVAPDYVASGFNMQNGPETDGVRIRNASSTVIDTALYGTPNTNSLIDDTGIAGVSFAPDVSEGHVIKRKSNSSGYTNGLGNGYDTNSSGNDFFDQTGWTPKNSSSDLEIPPGIYVLNAVSSDYESCVTDDDDLVNKKYIDDNVPNIYSGSSSPSSTPSKIGDLYIDTSVPTIYISTGTSSSSDWTSVN